MFQRNWLILLYDRRDKPPSTGSGLGRLVPTMTEDSTMKYTLSLFCTIIFICLTSCGFHLRGNIDLPPALHTFYVTGTSPYSPIVKAAEKQLRASKINIVNSSQKAPITLFVNSDNLTTQQTSIATNSALRNFNVTYAVNFELRNTIGQTIAGPYSVSSQQTVTAVENELLTNSYKLNQAKRELRAQE